MRLQLERRLHVVSESRPTGKVIPAGTTIWIDKPQEGEVRIVHDEQVFYATEAALKVAAGAIDRADGVTA